jgi:hypothetical protein
VFQLALVVFAEAPLTVLRIQKTPDGTVKVCKPLVRLYVLSTVKLGIADTSADRCDSRVPDITDTR